MCFSARPGASRPDRLKRGNSGERSSRSVRRRPTQKGQSYVVLQVVLKEKLFGTGSGNLTELERSINAQAALGYRLHTITTSASGSKGLGGGDRIQATLVFERLGIS